MGARINRYGRPKWDRRQVPRINWYLRYRACKRFGHKGWPCPRCQMKNSVEADHPSFAAISIICLEDMIPAITYAIDQPNPFLAYLKRNC